MKYVIGVDFGGTKIKAGIVSSNGQILNLEITETEAQKGKKQILEKTFSLIEKNLSEAKKSKITISGIGIGAPGPIDLQRGMVLSPPNLKDFHDVSLKQILAKKFKLPIELQNDANCALLGEIWKGAAKKAKNAIMLTLGTGIGGALLIDGKLYSGASGAAGELGHISIDSIGEECQCGKTGCLETYASAKSIELEALAAQLKTKNAREVVEFAAKGDAKAKKIVKEFIKYLSTGIANFINIFNPELVIIGGGIFKNSDIALNQLKKETGKKCFKSSFNKTRIIAASLTDQEAGVLGAAKQVLH